MSIFRTNILKIKAWMCSLPAQHAPDKPGQVATGQFQLHHPCITRFCEKSSSASLQRRTQRQHLGWGGPNKPSPSFQAHHRSHQSIKGSSSQVHRCTGAQSHSAKQIMNLEHELSVQGPPWLCQKKLPYSPLWNTWEGVNAAKEPFVLRRSVLKAVKPIKGCRANVFQDFIRILMSVFGGRI